MKIKHLLALAALITLPLQAETTVTLSGVHNCCKSCTNGITKAANTVKDVTVEADGSTIKVTAKSKINVKKAIEAIMAAGYFGTSDAADEKASSSSSSASAKKLTSATVTGAHLCCQKCVNAMTEAVKAVPGVTEYEIVSKASTFTVKGDFTENDLLASMNKAGFHGSVGK